MLLVILDIDINDYAFDSVLMHQLDELAVGELKRGGFFALGIDYRRDKTAIP
jgi:hypothetical protein